MSDLGKPAAAGAAPSAAPAAAAPAAPSGAAGAAAPAAENRRLAERRVFRSRAMLQFPGRPPMEVRTLDVSTSGMAIAAPSNLPASATCVLQVVLPMKSGARFPLQVNARVVHSVFSSAEGGFKVGMQFTGVPSSMSSGLSQFIEGK